MAFKMKGVINRILTRMTKQEKNANSQFNYGL